MIDMTNSRPIDEILDHISKERALNTQEWYQALIAFKNAGGSYERFEAWSLYMEYANNQSQIRRAWDNVHGKYTIGTLIHFARLDSPDFDAASFASIESGFPEREMILADNSTIQLPRVITKRPEPLVKHPDEAFTRLIKPFLATASEDELRKKSPLSIDWGDNSKQDAIQLLTNCYAPEDPVYIADVYPDYPRNLCRSPKFLTAEEVEQQIQRREEYKLKYQKDHIRPAGQWINDPNGDEGRSILLNPHIRPNPLSGDVAMTSDGKPSYVADACVKKFSFAVVEFDDKPLQDQLAFWLAMIDREFPVAAIIHSGGKSVHGWLYVNCDDRADWRENVENKLFRQYLEPIGADGQCKNPGRMSRLPGHYRMEKKRKQRLLYLNPGILTNTPQKGNKA